eukprot:TRINITY_DN38652_c0_g1_i1.p1 TRINITY_DN38652_c0_g1~~TRINITY_DN38652_c0_g1_i1.p1  ORF type:complete len:227 (+),score=25.48 TRINITY_DN38652_c0_g1_i1:157-837(+)
MSNSLIFPFDPFSNSFFRQSRRSKCNCSANGGNNSAFSAEIGWKFPTKAALTAASLSLAGDTAAQLRSRFFGLKEDFLKRDSATANKDFVLQKLIQHDWLRALRMTTYGFFLYGPGSHAWYEFLDKALPKKNLRNILLKVILNQIVLGPCVIAVIFAWNNLWSGNLKELPKKYKKDALPTLVYGWKFWIPASVLNFGAIPLQTRVAFMSCCSIFWNFYLSSTMVKV